MYRNRTVSLIVPAFNEEATIAEVVVDNLASGICDEIIVVNNNSSDSTGKKAKQAGARVIDEPRPGYGSALKRGMAESTADLLVLTEADGSFLAGDLPLILNPATSEERAYDFIIGTRTRPTEHSPLARMRGAGAWANLGVAQLLWLHGRPANGWFTDVGCTQRVLTRQAYKKIHPYFREDGPQFAPEMVVAALRCGLKILEVPVGYHPRRGGVSKHGANLPALTRTAIKMIQLIGGRAIRFPTPREEK